MKSEEHGSGEVAGRRPARVVVRIARRAVIAGLFVLAACLGSLGGVLFAYSNDLPQISSLDDYQPNTITRLLAADGSAVAQFATERRVVIRYEDMAPRLRQAIIAKEDAEFEQHFGLSITRIVVAGFRDVLHSASNGRLGRRGGASTITQQLARDMFLREYMRNGVFVRSGLEGLERKVKEWLVAIELERRYTKREIFTFYANQINLGHGAYGVEAASRMYFNKPAKDVTLEEAATLAAIIQTPSRLSPFVNVERNRTWRNFVLRRMAEEGYITQAEAGAAQERPIVLQGQPVPDKSIAPYFAEEIRKKLETQYGASDLYEAGLTVQTTLDSGLQAAANRALDRGLRRIDKRHLRYRGPLRNVVADGHDVLTFSSDRWNKRVQPGDIVPAVVLTVPAKAAGAVRVRIGTHEAELTAKALAWTKKPAAELFKAGDLIDVEVRSVDDAGAPRELALEQTPLVQGAIVAIDNRTGQIRAMVGGLDFERSKFNRATQANRQVGSLFKPIVYTAAIDAGYTATSIFIDEPVAYPAGPGQPPYSPLNYDRKFEGPVTLRRALEQSRNIPAVQAMADVGAQEVIAYARRFGLPGRYGPYLSMALGAGEATLLEMTSAYSVFPNQGVRMEPYAVVSIADRNGNIREQHRPQPREAIPADTAFIMTNLMRGVVERGTATAATALKWPLAGKTGTMDEYTDAWFIGFDPAITVGVWVGYDEKKPLGYGETGGAAALPIWIDVMRAYLERNADRKNPPDFEAPANIVFVPVEGGRIEAFINGTEPQEFPTTPAPAELRPPAPAAAAAAR